ncbi:MAG: DUF6011 domain-containing protein [Lachnospiraceae bacterium]|nr:DUF6011 domain-containing protein [Lachnospiraceae bacterium]
MTCSLCGRKLKNEKSQEIGYGPVCYRRKFGSPLKRQRIRDRGGGGEDIPYYDIPGQIEIEEYLKSLGNVE